MHKSNKTAFLNLYHFIVDFISLFISYWITYNVTCMFTNLLDIRDYFWILVIYVPVWMSIMTISEMYNNTTFNYYDRIFRYSFVSSVFSSILVVASMYFIKETGNNKLLAFNFFIITFIVMLIEKYIVLYVIKLPNSKATKQVMVIGDNAMYEQFKYYVNKTNININVIKYINVDSSETLNKNNALIDKEAFQQQLKQQVVDEIFFALPIKYFKEIQENALICEEMGVTSRILLDLIDTRFSRVHVASLGTLPMITFHSVSLNTFQLFIKRIVDIIGALTGMILTSFIWILVAVAIKLESKGPVFYGQDRVGKNGRIFKLYKFRSMHIDADERKKELLSQNELNNDLMFKIKNDPRITRVGKFIRKVSIDEVPQFINVLKGDMSLVGTRPPTKDEVAQYENYHYRRISIKPGITGMWQVSGRNAIKDFDEIVNLDTEYIDKWSIWLDFKIMIKTVFIVLFEKGAY